MHIPSSMLNGAVCPVTATVAAAGVGIAGYYAAKAKEAVSASKFAAVTSLIFALQMLNYPVQNGTSGHMIGAVLAVGLLGVPLAVLSMAVVLAVQTVFFADGGINALGANILNMSVIAAAAGGFLFRLAIAKGADKRIALGAASFGSVLLAATACSLELAFSGTVPLSRVLPAMLSVHALIGAGEGLLTVAVFSLLTSESKARKLGNDKAVVLKAVGISFLGALFSPLASGLPDGLEWVAGTLAFREFAAFDLPVLFSDYRLPFAVLGVGIVFAFASTVASLIKTKRCELA